MQIPDTLYNLKGMRYALYPARAGGINASSGGCGSSSHEQQAAERNESIELSTTLNSVISVTDPTVIDREK